MPIHYEEPKKANKKYIPQGSTLVGSSFQGKSLGVGGGDHMTEQQTTCCRRLSRHMSMKWADAKGISWDSGTLPPTCTCTILQNVSNQSGTVRTFLALFCSPKTLELSYYGTINTKKHHPNPGFEKKKRILKEFWKEWRVRKFELGPLFLFLCIPPNRSSDSNSHAAPASPHAPRDSCTIRWLRYAPLPPFHLSLVLRPVINIARWRHPSPRPGNCHVGSKKGLFCGDIIVFRENKCASYRVSCVPGVALVLGPWPASRWSRDRGEYRRDHDRCGYNVTEALMNF